MTYGDVPKRWASARGAVLAGSNLALPYCLKQVGNWLARGGMALGAPARCAWEVALRWVSCNHTAQRHAGFCARVLKSWWLVATSCLAPLCCSATLVQTFLFAILEHRCLRVLL